MEHIQPFLNGTYSTVPEWNITQSRSQWNSELSYRFTLHHKRFLVGSSSLVNTGRIITHLVVFRSQWNYTHHSFPVEHIQPFLNGTYSTVPEWNITQSRSQWNSELSYRFTLHHKRFLVGSSSLVNTGRSHYESCGIPFPVELYSLVPVEHIQPFLFESSSSSVNKSDKSITQLVIFRSVEITRSILIIL